VSRVLRAFISYRRGDDFVRFGQNREPDYSFVRKLKEALFLAGFNEVFVDIEAMEAGDEFTDRIREAIRECDLFVPVIGNKWLNILDERAARRGYDVLVREIAAALRQENEILPVLVDGAEMPGEDELPERIRRLQHRHAISVGSDDSAEAISLKLAPSFRKTSRAVKLKNLWRTAYITFAFAAYFVCAGLVHVVGILEYGHEPWLRMAQIWSGFYFWPIVCLPFALLALYRPLTLVFEFSTNATRAKDVLTYTSPLLVGLVVTILAIMVEVGGEFETPWTIYPTLPGCTDGRGPVAPRYVRLAEYDRNGSLEAQYSQPPFWLKNKCWPNVLFYLIEPAYRPIEGPDYSRDRPAVQEAFVAMLKSTAPHSLSFYVYVVSFSILIWFAATGVILAIFYVTVKIRTKDGRLLTLPSEDSYLCLTYAFVTLMMWIPFRMNTVYLKKLYFCPDLANCVFRAENYQNDIVLGVMFFIGYVYLTIGLLRKFQRQALALLGGLAVGTCIAMTIAIIAYGEDVARWTETWQFYVRVLIVVVTVLFALWVRFNPKNVHEGDDEKDNSEPRTSGLN
jgi:hypothetical protein